MCPLRNSLNFCSEKESSVEWHMSDSYKSNCDHALVKVQRSVRDYRVGSEHELIFRVFIFGWDLERPCGEGWVCQCWRQTLHWEGKHRWK